MMSRTSLKHLLQVILAAALLGASGPARAGDAGHYVGGMMDIRDYFVPDPGFYAALYNYFYTSDRYNDQNGNQVNSTTLPGGSGVAGQREPRHVCARPRFDLGITLEGPGREIWRVCGAHLRQCQPQRRRLHRAGPRRHGVRSDLRPGGHVCAAVVAGLDAPALGCLRRLRFLRPGRQIQHRHGRAAATVPASDNIGLGFWTQQFQGGAAWYPWTNRATAVTLVLTYEYNSPQQGTDVKYGQNLWLNWGISQYLPLTKDDKLLLEIGPAGYYEWQISSDTGGTSNPSSRTSVSAIGGQIGLTYVPWNLILNFRGMYEYAAEERVQGASFSINLIKKL